MELGEFQLKKFEEPLHLDCKIVLMVDRIPSFQKLEETFKREKWRCRGCFVRVDEKTMIDLSTERIAQEGV